MIREKENLFRSLVVIGDTCLVSLAYLGACFILSPRNYAESDLPVIAPEFFWAWVVFVACLMAVLVNFSLYKTVRTTPFQVIAWRLFKASCLSGLIDSMFQFFLKVDDLDRSCFLLAWIGFYIPIDRKISDGPFFARDSKERI